MIEAILDAAARVLVREGFARATTNRVAEAAGISVGSLYQYFPSKEAIVVELLRRHRAAMVEVIGAHLARLEEEPTPRHVRALVQAVLDAHGINPKLHRVLIEEVLHREARAEVSGFVPSVEAMLRAALEKNRDKLRVKHIDVASFLLVRFVLAIAHAAVVEEPARGRDPRIVDELTDILGRYLVERPDPR
jgi:AcrR family transcriptional regulator